jgi:hypothetical protein
VTNGEAEEQPHVGGGDRVVEVPEGPRRAEDALDDGEVEDRGVRRRPRERDRRGQREARVVAQAEHARPHAARPRGEEEVLLSAVAQRAAHHPERDAGQRQAQDDPRRQDRQQPAALARPR